MWVRWQTRDRWVGIVPWLFLIEVDHAFASPVNSFKEGEDNEWPIFSLLAQFRRHICKTLAYSFIPWYNRIGFFF